MATGGMCHHGVLRALDCCCPCPSQGPLTLLLSLCQLVPVPPPIFRGSTTLLRECPLLKGEGKLRGAPAPLCPSSEGVGARVTVTEDKPASRAR